MTTYHVYIDTDEYGKHVPVLLDREPAQHQGALKTWDEDTETTVENVRL